MAWPRKHREPNGEASDDPTEQVAPGLTWKRLAGMLALLGFIGTLAGIVYAGGAAMNEKASRQAVTDVEAAADKRIDQLEQERASVAAELRAIRYSLKRIEDKLDRSTP